MCIAVVVLMARLTSCVFTLDMSLPPGSVPHAQAPLSRSERKHQMPRRSSSRSIKRKKFDDELVESSLKKASKRAAEGFAVDKDKKLLVRGRT